MRVSVEWKVPFGATAFHMGIHNLPSGEGAAWMKRLAEFTAMPVETRAPKLLTEMLAELDELPGVLIVFNHPLWDLYRVGKEKHEVLVNEFLAVNGQFVHALELNGLRDWKENREAAALAGEGYQPEVRGRDADGEEADLS